MTSALRFCGTASVFRPLTQHQGGNRNVGQLGVRIALCCALITVFSFIVLVAPSVEAGELRLETLSLRAGFSGVRVIGDNQPDYFNQFDVAVTARLPWEKEFGTGWVLGTRVLASAGVLSGAQETPGIFTLVPFYVFFGRKDGLISIDMGVGGALVTDYKFDGQNFGGPFQFVWTFGVTSRFAGPFGAGYHFQHFSDAGMYGNDSRGVDLHLFDLIYWFDAK